MNKIIYENMEYLKNDDYEIYEALNLEFNRQQNNLELIASENIASPSVMAAMASVATNKYAEGYCGKRYYGGCEYIDQIESLAIERAKKLFNCTYANVQPHSGAQANLAVQYALLNPGDTLMGMSLDCGGHLTHGSSANISGHYFNIVAYGVNEQGYLDYGCIRSLALKHKPKVICAGASAYPRVIDFKKFREIADECGAYLWVDMAHIAGLVATGLHPSPIPYAHVVTSTTHKTLRGPRGGVILSSEEFAYEHALNKAIFPGIQGGPLENIIAAKAVCFKEALKYEFKEYQQFVINNCLTLANHLKDKGFKLITDGTDNHLMLIDLTNFNLTGKYFQNICDDCHITLNKNSIPNEPLSPFITSGVRIGTAAITSRGFMPNDMEIIANCLYMIATDYPHCKNKVIELVGTLVNKYPIYQ